LNEALHFNGRKWSEAKTPNPAGSGLGDENFLFGLACAAASDCWAVGYTERGSGAADVNEALRWSGRNWSAVKTPDPKGNSPDHYNQLDGVTCVSTSDCWGVGFAGDSTGFLNEALRFNGKKWSHFKTPQPGTSLSEAGNPLVGVACTSANDCWAVGYYFNNSGTAVLNEALRFDGKRWSHVRTPQPAGTNMDLNTLSGVACPSASDCRAVGTASPFSTPSVNEALHWNGRRWSKR
jgi:hypothetical protein